MSELTCPRDARLLPLATGESVEDSIQSHVDACDDCRQRLEEMRTDVAEMRRSAEELRTLMADSQPKPFDDSL